MVFVNILIKNTGTKLYTRRNKQNTKLTLETENTDWTGLRFILHRKIEPRFLERFFFLAEKRENEIRRRIKETDRKEEGERAETDVKKWRSFRTEKVEPHDWGICNNTEN